MKSAKYKTLMDYIANGQIDEILAQDWFPEGSEVNGYWTAIIRDLKKIKESGKTTDFVSASKIVRENSGNGENVTLSNMYRRIEELAYHNQAKRQAGGGAGGKGGKGSSDGSGHVPDREPSSPARKAPITADELFQ